MLPCLCDRSPHTLLGSKVPRQRWGRGEVRACVRAGALCRGKPNGTYRKWRAAASLVVKSTKQRVSPHGCVWDVQSVGCWPWKVLLIQRVNCQPLLPAVPRIAASLKVKNSSQDFVLFHGWVVPSNTARSKRLFKETAGCTLRLCLISHTTLHSSPQTGSR